ncbi:MAG TPA: hypothetical protein VJU79_05235, partial [Candidatus Dormibacteraeota bacterium]|nr:hypothetical protein [Candidatus Dormibacteraeota bacterium]
PSVPFWLGEAPGRTHELSREVSSLRAAVDSMLEQGNADSAVTWVQETCGVDNEVAAMVVRYLAAGRAGLGVVPTMERIVIERFFDDSGGMQVVVHAPYGARLNRALGLALRKRFCATFDFELQAAASDDSVLLSLGPQHSLPLEDVPRFLSSATVEEVLTRAALFAPMFQVRWRWNLNRALAVLRFKGGRKNPAPLQRLESDDIMAAVFPALVACQNENPTGQPIPIPDHLLVRQTLYDCMHEAMDVDGLRELVGRLERGEVEVVFRDTVEPSPFAHEIINGKPYTFLDDAPLEERRSRAISTRRGLPVEARDLAALDPEAIARVRAEAAPEPRDPDELHDLLLSLVVTRPQPAWHEWFAELVARRRALTVRAGAAELWAPVEQRARIETLFDGAVFEPDHRFQSESAATDEPDPAAIAADVLRGHLEVTGPCTEAQLAEMTALPGWLVSAGAAMLESTGFALRGHFDPALDAEQWCARRLLVRIHSYTQQRLRREIEPVTAQDYMRFLLRWQHVATGHQVEGRAGLVSVIEQLQGFELPAGSWEEDVLRARITGYRREWLDQLCLSGEVAWGRLRVRDDGDAGAVSRGLSSTSRATPITMLLRADLPWLLQAARGELRPAEPDTGATRQVLDALRSSGALFISDICDLTRRLPTEVENALWDGVARGLITADGFAAVRGLLFRRQWASSNRRRGLRRSASGRSDGEGRWSLLPSALSVADREALAEAVAEQLLVRWGVVFRDVVTRETLNVAWRDILWALRRMEARGTARGGRFVTGFIGEQYALPEAVEQLRAVRKAPRTDEQVRLSAADPLNLAGIITPGPRIPAIRTNTVVFRDGLPEPAGSVAPPLTSELSRALTAAY